MFGSTLLSLVVADLLFRWLAPRPFAVPTLTDHAGRRVTLYQILAALRTERPREHDGPRGPGPVDGLGAPFTIGYDRPRWDYFDAGGCVTFGFNSLGFRDREFAVAERPGEYRVLAIGDSMTFGLGVPMEDSWPQQLERRLIENRNSPVEVINAGFAGRSGSPVGYQPWLATDGIALRPDLVILGFCLNDMHPNIPMLGYQIVRAEPLLFGISAILNYLHQRSAQSRAKARPFDASTILAKYGDSHWRSCQAAMRGMHESLTQAGIHLLVVIQPMITRLGDDYPYLRLHEMVRAFCADAGIECLDLLPRFRGRDAEALQVHPTDQHPNDVAHRLIADGIFDHLTGR